MASISLQGVTKLFGGKKVADRITLDVADREFLVLLGPSGCGKSTLLRMLAGLEQVTSGEIHVGARRVDTLPPSARDMAFVFQSYALYPHMTVRRNITFPLIMRAHRWWFHLPLIGGLAKRRIEQQPAVRALVERTAKTLALTEMLEQYPRTLSGGQRQRVALGRAMVRQPDVFLMDEPLSNLDAKLRSSMRAEIIKLHREVGGTFVYVTHDQIEAMTMGTRIALMRDGVVQQFGTPRDIYTDPANTFVARFIGTPPMNLIEARIDPQRGLLLGPLVLPLPAQLAALAPRAACDVLLGIRPHALGLSQGQGQGSGALAGQVVLVEHVGAESIVSVRLDHARTAHHGEDSDGGGGDGSAEVMAVLQGYSELCAGQSVHLLPDLAEAVLFARDGQRIRAS
ncbi:ABC transporter ATP-binding protein [Verminephrobacter aporrectodeae subsp. tuberculatae]|uniref:ABC transporter ATP-binding protein n=1 Tax=Verminephrobacter aporrectodeae TaxID=1110389 RepID=UPI002244A850|nr:ABC transporter ATP-binding protein [Verminephrobacter aporrectodeae]MCW8165614.1 ABC transporter ATP-binding protein [Verminephrobacter aporrectodeae subsp. tuberculatae]MCW8168403.1 ABC transporter ATP-binding protein [Verminephrobacter aporrectodeae subsp. tuberculatae]